MGKCCGASEQEAVVLFHERLRELRFFLAERPPDAAGGGHTKPRRRIVEHDRDGGSELDAAVAADHPGEEKASERRRARFEALLSALAAARSAVVDCWVAVAQAAASRQVANGAETACWKSTQADTPAPRRDRQRKKGAH